MRTVDKAFAYITHGESLLVFRHVDFPEAGIQVPAGTIQPGEPPDQAARREAHEETGLNALVLIGPLGVVEVDMSPFGKAEIHRRHFFHFRFNGEAPQRWRHHERDPSEGGGPILFELFWTDISDPVPLIAGHGHFLGALVR